MQDIVIENLCKAYEGKPVLDHFSATLSAGSITGLMAPSGAGKTTLLRLLMGLETPDSGTITGLAGVRLSAVFQEDRLCDNLSAVSNIRLVNPLLSVQEVERALERVGLSDALGQPRARFPAACGAASPFSVRCWQNTIFSCWTNRLRGSIKPRKKS